MAGDFVRVASADQVVAGDARAFALGDRELALFNVGGAFYALDNVCPHQGAPLAEGWIDGYFVTCPWHAWCFDVRSGRMKLGGFEGVDSFDVRVDDGEVLVRSEPRTR